MVGDVVTRVTIFVPPCISIGIASTTTDIMAGIIPISKNALCKLGPPVPAHAPVTATLAEPADEGHAAEDAAEIMRFPTRTRLSLCLLL